MARGVKQKKKKRIMGLSGAAIRLPLHKDGQWREANRGCQGLAQTRHALKKVQQTYLKCSDVSFFQDYIARQNIECIAAMINCSIKKLLEFSPKQALLYFPKAVVLSFSCATWTLVCPQ